MKKNKTILLFVCMLAMALYAGAQQAQGNGNASSNASQTKAQPEAKNQAATQPITDAALIYEAQHKQDRVKNNSSLPSKTSSKKTTNLQPNKSSQGNK